MKLLPLLLILTPLISWSELSQAETKLSTTLPVENNKTNTRAVIEPQIPNDSPQFCINPNTDLLIGHDYLDQKFLLAIDKITPLEGDLKTITNDMILIKGGQFEMGADIPEGFADLPKTALPQADEYPKHPVQLSNFYMDQHEVTVGEYLEFVKATGYITVAEQDVDWQELKKQLPPNTPKPNDADLKAGAMVFHLIEQSDDRNNLANWWSFIHGADWRSPQGDQNNTEMDKILNLPVTQVSWYDAMAYAKWRGKRLPTEAEFEYAMRAGEKNQMYPWGNEQVTDSNKKGNFLQGAFPYTNTTKDGYALRAPVKSFPANAYGLYDIAGNVWEWTSDWYGADYYRLLSMIKKTAIDPQGPSKSHEIYQRHAINKVVRGGSFLCNDSWCSGYRNSRRMRLSPDSGMQHVGFRCAKSIVEASIAHH